MTTTRVNLLTSHTLEAIRRIDPERIILVTPGEWSSAKELENLRLPADQNPCSPATAEELLGKAAAWSAKYGSPLHLGEFGAVTTAEPADRIEYVRNIRTIAESHNIPWTLWDWKAGFAYWDKETNTPLLRQAIFAE